MPFNHTEPIDGVSYLTDGEGNRLSMVIDIEKHYDFLEDFVDVLIATQRIHDGEPAIPWAQAMEALNLERGEIAKASV